MRRARLFVLVAFVLAAGCAAGSPSAPSPSPSTPASRGWTELRIAWDFGPCPNDGRSCHQALVVKPDGGFIAQETPSAPAGGPPPEPMRRFAALDPQEVRELHRIVDGELADKLGALGCPPEYDATIRVELEGPWGVRHDEIGGCAHLPDPKPNLPRRLIDLLARHRFANRDAPATNPTPPSGEGDPCTVDLGCANGLVCAVFPCLVAPCTSGACRKPTK